MRPAVALSSASIARCRRCAAGIILLLMCCGCGRQQAAPHILNLPDCPAPPAPVLPELDAAEPLDSPENVARLLTRDDRMRAYMDGLIAALRCHQARGKI